MSAAFDTLATVQDLEVAGIERRHAEAIAKAINHGDERAAMKADIERLRTAIKADIERLRTAIKADIERLRAATKADIERLRAATKADIERLRAATKADIDTATTDLRAGIAHVAARLDGVRSELGAMRWAIGLLAAFVFAIGLRIFGLL